MSNLSSNPQHGSSANGNIADITQSAYIPNGDGYQTYPNSDTAYSDFSAAYSMPSTNNIQGVVGTANADLAAFGSYNEDTKDDDQSEAKSTKPKETQVTFPQRLLQVLDEEEANEIISWLPHGNSFIVYDKKKFVDSILPRFFKESKFTSFTRKLNRWGFTRISRGVETGAYHHEFFRRDNPELCLKMKCQKKHEKKINTIGQNPKKSSTLMKDKLKKKSVEEVISRTTTISSSTSPPPLAYPNSSSVALSASPDDDVPPLKNNNASKSNLYIKLQQQQREIEQRLQKAVQDASQQHKPRHLFPQSFLQAQQNIFSGQSPPPLSQHNMGPTPVQGMSNGMMPLVPQSMPPQSMPPRTMSSNSIGEPIIMPNQQAQAPMPVSYLSAPGMYGETNGTTPVSAPNSEPQTYKSSDNPSFSTMKRIGDIARQGMNESTPQPYMGSIDPSNYADADDQSDDDGDGISYTDSV